MGQRGKQFWIKRLGKGWAMQLKSILKSPYETKLMNFLSTEYAMNEIVPIRSDVFNAFKLCPWDSVRVVIIGSGPSAGSQPNGLAYGDKFTTLFHSSQLCTIHECLEKERGGFYLDFDFTLENWAKQGVLLLNKCLTSRVHDQDSHRKQWGKFISEVLNVLNENKQGIIYVLWGKEMQLLKPHLEKNNHILTYSDPGIHANKGKLWRCPNFKEINKILINDKINW